MRVAILTLPFHSNYGGILQAYALQTVLKRLGHEVVIVDADHFYHRPWWRQQIALVAYLFRKYLLWQETVYVDLWKADHRKRLKEKRMRQFISAHMNILKVNDLRMDFPRDIDAVVVGSDQVWRNRYFSWSYNCGIENAYLAFLETKPIKRIAYAASFGTGEWEYTEEETQRCAELLKRFDAVSVREFSGVKLCREKMGYSDVVRMPDPTLLLSSEDYRQLFARRKNKQKTAPYILYYVLDETSETRTVAEKIASEHGLVIKSITGDKETILPRKGNLPVEDWLRGIDEAKYVFTDSFHACVFSIVFRKPFIVVGNQERGTSRFQSLLSTFGLEKNMLTSLKINDLRADYSLPENVSAVLSAEQKKGMLFLRENLNGYKR